MKSVLSTTQKFILAVSACLMVAALAIKYVPLQQNLSIVVGLVEVVLAISIGISLGVAATKARP